MPDRKDQQQNSHYQNDHNLRQHHDIVDQARNLHAHVVDERDGEDHGRCSRHDVTVASNNAQCRQRVTRQRVTHGGQASKHLDNH